MNCTAVIIGRVAGNRRAIDRKGTILVVNTGTVRVGPICENCGVSNGKRTRIVLDAASKVSGVAGNGRGVDADRTAVGVINTAAEVATAITGDRRARDRHAGSSTPIVNAAACYESAIAGNRDVSNKCSALVVDTAPVANATTICYRYVIYKQGCTQGNTQDATATVTVDRCASGSSSLNLNAAGNA